MKCIKKSDSYLIKLEKGDRLAETLLNFLGENKIKFSKFDAIGAVTEAELAFYSLKDKQYHRKTFKGEFEVTGLIGNSSMHEGRPIIHAHATIADEKFHAFGGHVMEMVAAGTLEVFLKVLPFEVERKYDAETGLKLLDI
ncbi:MAG: DNA-binding protein [Candidatus Aenigmarchaeota archaeon]|nr:DNA-binding protein [Candidatus Aenigmarchaeota archaeon]